MKVRQLKKRESLQNGRTCFFGWLNDLRCYLMEAVLEDDVDLEIIIRQFKHRYTKGRKRARLRDFQATRMRTYAQWCLGDAYGRECRR